MDSMINADKGIPLYLQVKQILMDGVRGGKFKPGNAIPSERELAEKFELNRLTVRRAVDELVNEGYLVRKRGSGTYVAQKKESRTLSTFCGFTDDMSREGYQVTSALLEYELMPADAGVSKWLEVPEGEVCVRLKRLRLINDEPVGIALSYIPYSRCRLSKEDCINSSLYAAMRLAHGLVFSEAEQYVSATNATTQEAQLLKIRQGGALVLAEGRTFLETGLPVEYFRNKYRGDQIRFYSRATELDETQ